MKPAKNEITIDHKLSANYLADTLINFQKRIVTNECKQRKYKKKIYKLIDIYTNKELNQILKQTKKKISNLSLKKQLKNWHQHQ
jgi:hypothetical protein